LIIYRIAVQWIADRKEFSSLVHCGYFFAGRLPQRSKPAAIAIREGNMLMKLPNILLLLVLTIATGYAEEPPLAVYDLKIFGYQLGMSYDQAVAVRAFHYTSYHPAENQMIGIINSAYIEDVEFQTAVHFQDGIAFKIIGRFDPKCQEPVLASLKKAFGEGEENTRRFTSITGTEIKQTICKWSYPGANIVMIGLSNNTEFATLSMVSSTLSEPDPEP
jgi:hypothetical protein